MFFVVLLGLFLIFFPESTCLGFHRSDLDSESLLGIFSHHGGSSRTGHCVVSHSVINVPQLSLVGGLELCWVNRRQEDATMAAQRRAKGGHVVRAVNRASGRNGLLPGGPDTLASIKGRTQLGDGPHWCYWYWHWPDWCDGCCGTSDFVTVGWGGWSDSWSDSRPHDVVVGPASAQVCLDEVPLQVLVVLWLNISKPHIWIFASDSRDSRRHDAPRPRGKSRQRRTCSIPDLHQSQLRCGDHGGEGVLPLAASRTHTSTSTTVPYWAQSRRSPSLVVVGPRPPSQTAQRVGIATGACTVAC